MKHGGIERLGPEATVYADPAARCWTSKKKKKNIRPLGLFRGLFPDTEWLPTTLSHSCGWMEHIPSSETMCVKGLSKI